MRFVAVVACLFCFFLPFPNHSDAQEVDPKGIISVAWSPDGTMIAAVGEGGFVGIFDSHTHALIRTLLGSTGDVYAVDWNSTSTQIVTVGGDARLIIWDVNSGNVVAEISNFDFPPFQLAGVLMIN